MAKNRRKSSGDTSPEVDAAPQAAGDTTAATPARDRVAMRAYELYVARGGSDGQALDDWIAAERELDDERTRRDDEKTRPDKE